MFQPEDLIGTKFTLPADISAYQVAQESAAYYNLCPYPTYAFGALAKDKNEPMPEAPLYSRIVVDELASFMFQGGAPVFSVPDNGLASAYLADVIKRNKLNGNWLALARNLGVNGSVAIKFNWEPDDVDQPVKLSFLNVPQQCRVWMSPFDNTKPIFARIQFEYQDPTDGAWFLWREEWTAKRWVEYKPKKLCDALRNGQVISDVTLIPNYLNTLGDDGEWEVESDKDNPFGVIPIYLLKNRALLGVPHGICDCYNTFRTQDRLAVTFHLQDIYNQTSSKPTIAALNAEIENTSPLAPGEILNLTSGLTEAPVDVKVLEAHGNARQWVAAYVEKYEQLLQRAVGLSDFNAQTLSNSGQMTAAMFRLVFSRSIATCDQKRDLWGQALCEFFAAMLTGLSNYTKSPDLKGYSPNTQEVSVKWENYFIPTDPDLTDMTNRTLIQVQAGWLTNDRAAARCALAEGIPLNEIPNILAEVKNELTADTTAVYGGKKAAGDDTDVAVDELAVVGEISDSTPRVMS